MALPPPPMGLGPSPPWNWDPPAQTGPPHGFGTPKWHWDPPTHTHSLGTAALWLWGHHGDKMATSWGHKSCPMAIGTLWRHHRDTMGTLWRHHRDTMGTKWGHHGDTRAALWPWGQNGDIMGTPEPPYGCGMFFGDTTVTLRPPSRPRATTTRAKPHPVTMATARRHFTSRNVSLLPVT